MGRDRDLGQLVRRHEVLDFSTKDACVERPGRLEHAVFELLNRQRDRPTGWFGTGQHDALDRRLTNGPSYAAAPGRGEPGRQSDRTTFRARRKCCGQKLASGPVHSRRSHRERAWFLSGGVNLPHGQIGFLKFPGEPGAVEQSRCPSAALTVLATPQGDPGAWPLPAPSLHILLERLGQVMHH